MRTALGEPLQNVSDNILNRVVSKSIQADLRKYKMGKKPDRGTSAGRERTRSPVARRERFAASPDENFDVGSLGALSKEVTHYLSQLNTSNQNKISLIKMQVIKCDDYSNIFSRMRQCLNHGSTEEAEQLLAELEESNHQSYLDLRNEIADGTNASETIGLLCEQMKKERIEQAQTNRGRSTS